MERAVDDDVLQSLHVYGPTAVVVNSVSVVRSGAEHKKLSSIQCRYQSRYLLADANVFDVTRGRVHSPFPGKASRVFVLMATSLPSVCVNAVTQVMRMKGPERPCFSSNPTNSLRHLIVS